MTLPQQSTINLYIHPDSGPVVMLELDMLDIELSIIHSDVNSNRDNARVDRIMDFIRSHYPEVRPEASREQLRVLISRLASLSIYSGVVLRLPGTIQAATSSTTGYALEDILKLTEEIAGITTRLHEAERKRDENNVLAEALRRQHDNIKRAHEETLKQISKAHEERKEAEEGEAKAVKEAKQLQLRVNVLEQDVAELETELEKERRELAIAAASQKEVARLRQQLADAKDAERILRDSLKRKEQEMDHLQQKAHELAEEANRVKASMGKPDQAKGPWLD